MRLMQHMLPGLLSEPDLDVVAATALPVPEGAVLQKSVVTAIAGALSAIAGPIATIVTAPGNNRTAQELARQETLRTEMLVADAARAREANLQMLRMVLGASLAGVVLYFLFK